MTVTNMGIVQTKIITTNGPCCISEYQGLVNFAFEKLNG